MTTHQETLRRLVAAFTDMSYRYAPGIRARVCITCCHQNPSHSDNCEIGAILAAYRAAEKEIMCILDEFSNREENPQSEEKP